MDGFSPTNQNNSSVSFHCKIPAEQLPKLFFMNGKTDLFFTHLGMFIFFLTKKRTKKVKA